ncbi:hypothetical protein HK102_013076, partial [Quaeritorhiza haematococci]
DPLSVPRVDVGLVSLFSSGSTLVIPDSLRVGGDLYLETLAFRTARIRLDVQDRLSVSAENGIVMAAPLVTLPETLLADVSLRVSKMANDAVLSSATNMILQPQGHVRIPKPVYLDDYNHIYGNGYDLMLNAIRDVVVQGRYCVVNALKIQDSLIQRIDDSLVFDSAISIRQGLVLTGPLVLGEQVSLSAQTFSLVITAPGALQVDSDTLNLRTTSQITFGTQSAGISLSSDQRCVIRAPNGVSTSALALTEYLAVGDAH